MNKIKQFREELGLSQAELGKVIGCSQQHIDRFEKGYSLKPDKILLLADYLKIPVEELIPDDWKEIFDRATNKSINCDIYSTIATVVKTVEEFLIDHKKTIEPERKAQLISSLVAMLSDVPEKDHAKLINFAIEIEVNKKAV